MGLKLLWEFFWGGGGGGVGLWLILLSMGYYTIYEKSCIQEIETKKVITTRQFEPL